MKHTKGNWRVQKHVEDIEEVNFTVESDIKEAKYFSICDVYGFNLGQAKDNARLIAKAPEMLESLTYAYELLARVDTKYPARDTVICQFNMAGIRSLLKELE